MSTGKRYVAEERVVDSAAADMVRLWATSLVSAGGDLHAKLDWFYRAAPCGPARALLLTAFDGDAGTVVGCEGIGFRRVWLGDRVVRAALLADLAVDPGHRTLAPALLLVRRARETAASSAEFQYGFPNRKAIGVFQRVGYRPLGAMARSVRVLRFGPYLARRVRVPLLASLGGAVLDGAATVHRALPRLRAAAAFRLSFPSGPDERFDALFDEARSRYGVIADRGRDFIRWRFFAGQGRAELATLERRGDGALRAYAVVTRRDGVAHLSDFLAVSGRELEALLALLLPALRAQGCTSASARFLGTARIRRLLERSGFRLRDAERTVVIDAGGDPARAAVIADVENHYLTDADEDN